VERRRCGKQLKSNFLIIHQGIPVFRCPLPPHVALVIKLVKQDREYIGTNTITEEQSLVLQEEPDNKQINYKAGEMCYIQGQAASGLWEY
jgi:hypothetical protein